MEKTATKATRPVSKIWYSLVGSSFGCSSKLKSQGKPQVLVFVSIGGA